MSTRYPHAGSHLNKSGRVVRGQVGAEISPVVWRVECLVAIPVSRAKPLLSRAQQLLEKLAQGPHETLEHKNRAALARYMLNDLPAAEHS